MFCKHLMSLHFHKSLKCQSFSGFLQLILKMHGIGANVMLRKKGEIVQVFNQQYEADSLAQNRPRYAFPRGCNRLVCGRLGSLQNGGGEEWEGWEETAISQVEAKNVHVPLLYLFTIRSSIGGTIRVDHAFDETV